MKHPKFYRGRPIIQTGETYGIDGVPYKVITATSSIISVRGGNINMTGIVYWLDNIETGNRVYMGIKELESKFKESNQI